MIPYCPMRRHPAYYPNPRYTRLIKDRRDGGGSNFTYGLARILRIEP